PDSPWQLTQLACHSTLPARSDSGVDSTGFGRALSASGITHASISGSSGWSSVRATAAAIQTTDATTNADQAYLMRRTSPGTVPSREQDHCQVDRSRHPRE